MEVKVKVPPQSKDAERIVLGCMLTSINAFNIAADALVANDFYYVEHKTLFQCLKNLFIQDKPVDVHIVSEELTREGTLKNVGGIGYVMELAQCAGTSAYIEEYVKIVKDKATLRSILNVAQIAEKKVLDNPDDVIGTLDEVQQLLFKISQANDSKQGRLMQEIIKGFHSKSGNPFWDDSRARMEQFKLLGPHARGVVGLKTHFIDLDKMLNGFNNSNLIILAARPSMGKTALALNIVENICFKENKSVGIFSLEMSGEQLMHRMLCSQAEVIADREKTGALSEEEYQRIESTAKRLASHPDKLIIDDQPNLKISDLRARARRMKEAHNIEFLVIDYLQLLTGSSNKMQENRQQEISEISRMLKSLARELDIPILCLSQLSRKVEERTGHRPMMSDLRESGSIEQDADIVMFLFRGEYYDSQKQRGMAEIIVGKNRHGGIGNIILTFRNHIAQFSNFLNGNQFNPED